MRICGFHIDGFGIFHDQGIQDVPGGFALFLGQNESGKTTLMEFFRAALFGFPDRRSKRNRYEPLRGGNHGGRLKVVMDESGEPLELHGLYQGGHTDVSVKSEG